MGVVFPGSVREWWMWYVIFFRQIFFLIHLNIVLNLVKECHSRKHVTSKGIESYKHVKVQVSMARVSKLFSVRNFFLWGVLVSTKITRSPCFPFQKFWLHRRHLPDRSVGLSLCILMVLLSQISPCFSPKKTHLGWYDTRNCTLFTLFTYVTTSLFERKHCSSPD